LGNEKLKSIIAIISIITVLSGIFLYRGIYQYKETMNDKIAETIVKTNVLIDEVIRNSNIIYDVRLDALVGNEQIIKAFFKKEREKLYRIVLPFHQSLEAENINYSNMHFHLPSGISFLRMHKPEEYGDDLKFIRPIILEVHKDNKAVHGYEIGKHGLFYRVAKPVFFNDDYIGALEIGIKVKQVAENIERILNVKVARFIDDSILNEEFSKNCKEELIIQGNSLNTYENNSLFRSIFKTYNFNNTSPQSSDVNDIHRILFRSGQLKNYLGETIARFIVSQNITREIHEFNSFIYRSVILTMILITGAYVILHFSFGTYIKKIIELNKTLENKVLLRTKDLTEVTDKLQITNAELNQIFNTAADGMRVIDKNYRVLRVNDTFSRLIRKDKDLLRNCYCHEHFKGKFCFSPECTLKRILRGEQYIEIDIQKEMDNGEKRSFLLTATPFKSSNGEILGVVENFKDITRREAAAKALQEHEQYLEAIMSTVLAGVIITDEKSPTIIDANPYAMKLIGLNREDIKKTSIRDHLSLETPWIESVVRSGRTFEKEDFILTTSRGNKINIRLSVARVTIKDKVYLVQSFSDITDVKNLLKKQLVDIYKAKSIMMLINNAVPRSIELPAGYRLFIHSISVPCFAEGGDHFFIQHFTENTNPKTLISLKDQSGHEVNCILRSIYTDLMHHALNYRNRDKDIETIINQLNKELYQADYFNNDEFFTSINAEIDHKTLLLRYVSAGHPPFILIRDRCVVTIPDVDQKFTGCNFPIPFLKDAKYTSDQLQLKENDQLIFFTDGLTDMGLKNLDVALDYYELQNIIQTIIDEIWISEITVPPVSQLMELLMNEISGRCQETVIPDINGLESVNSSSDDVTILGLEIEHQANMKTFSLKPEGSEEITDFINSVVDELFISRSESMFSHLENKVKMILEEAIINAWKHGNGKNAEKHITVKISTRNDFVFEVIDQGKGFNYKDLPDPTLEVNIDKTNGRGLFIINHFSDSMEWRGNGNHLVIILRKIKEHDERNVIRKTKSQINIWEGKKQFYEV